MGGAKGHQVEAVRGSLALRILHPTQRIISGAHEIFFRVDEMVAIKTRQFVVGPHPDRVDRTSLFAHAAKNAAQHVDIKFNGIFFDARIRVLPRGNVDAGGGARRRAEHAGRAANLATLFYGEDLQATETLGIGTPFFRVLNGRQSSRVEKISKKVAPRNQEPFKDRQKVHALADGQVVPNV